jgi:DNA excision repair protein ERCC-2
LPPAKWRFFPYPSFKPNQERLLAVTYDAAKGNSHAIVDGASGLGKTVGALAGAIEACRERDLKILYAARTYKQLDRVVEELQAINAKEKVSGISIRGRAEMCVNEAVLRLSRDPRMVMELCSDLVGSGKCPFYNNLDDKAREARSLISEFTASPSAAFELIEKARKSEFCPYEITKLLLPNVDVVALSYAYIFNSGIRESFMKKLGRPISQYVLILDEAHNLPEIANEYESDLITSGAIASAVSEADHYGKMTAKRFAQSFLKRMEGAPPGESATDLKAMAEEAAKEANVGQSLAIFLEDAHAFGEAVKSLQLSRGNVPRSHIHRMSEFLMRATETAGRSDFVQLINSVGRKPASITTALPSGQGEKSIRLEIVSLDPRSATGDVIKNAAATISMSGTLENTGAYRELLGIPDSAVSISLPSPFPEEQTLFLACKGVSTLYEKRCAEGYARMVARVGEVVSSTPGNSAVFCSSYEVMEGLIGGGLEKVVVKPLYVERQRAKSVEQDALIKEFKSMGVHGGAVLLGVMGGRFSEGEDYPGDELNSTVIVGVPYPKPTSKVDAQIKYYESVFPGRGRDYGYVLPAMRKASQSAGRPFRNLDDVGAVIFLDYRYSTRFLAAYLPSWIRERLRTVDDGEPIAEAVGEFYRNAYPNSSPNTSEP